MKKYLLVIIVLTLLSLWPFFKKGYFTSHDGEWMVIRFSAFHQTLVAGQFPVRFVDRLNNNYGYPVLNFLYPGPFYLSEIFKLVGFNFVNSVKMTFVATTLVSSIAMFWAMSKKFDVLSSTTAAILYLYVPYRFVDIYVRGSIGENMAFAIIPIILGCIFQIERKNIIYLPVLSLTTALLVLSHNVLAAVFLPVFALVALIIIRKDIIFFLLFLILGILISSFFWLPALLDLQYVRLLQIKVANPIDHLVTLKDLLVPKWGYGAIPSHADGFSIQIGIASIFTFTSAVFLIAKKRLNDKLAFFSIVAFIATLFLITNYSGPVWSYVPLIDTVQYPWRLLSVVVFLSALTGAIVVNNVKNKLLWSLVIIILAISSSALYMSPAAFVDRSDGFYSTNEDTTTIKDEYLPLWVKNKPIGRAAEKFQTDSSVRQENVLIKPSYYIANLTSTADSKVIINTIYFPGHKVYVNGKQTDINYENEHGLITFKLPTGNNKVIIKYTKSPVHLASEILSLIALCVTGILFFKLWRKQNS